MGPGLGVVAKGSAKEMKVWPKRQVHFGKFGWVLKMEPEGCGCACVGCLLVASCHVGTDADFGSPYGEVPFLGETETGLFPLSFGYGQQKCLMRPFFFEIWAGQWAFYNSINKFPKMRKLCFGVSWCTKKPELPKIQRLTYVASKSFSNWRYLT